MDRIENYSIAFSGLNSGKHEFVFDITQSFFDLFDTEQDILGSNIKANVLLDKHSTFLEFMISIEGTVDLTCDISNELYEESIKNEMKILVNFGEEYDDSNDEVITISHHESDFNVAQLIYEQTVLSIPMKKISPKVTENGEYYNLLEKFSPKEEEEEEKHNENSDPRWETLKKLRDNN